MADGKSSAPPKDATGQTKPKPNDPDAPRTDEKPSKPGQPVTRFG